MDNSKSIKFNLNKLLLKATALVVTGVFLVNTVFIDFVWAKANSFLRATVVKENPVVQRGLLASMYRRNRLIWVAKSEKYKNLLAKYNAQALFLPSGRYLIKQEVAEDNLLLIKNITHEDFELLMQEWERKYPDKYQKLLGQISNRDDITGIFMQLFLEGDIDFKYLLSKAFELCFLVDEGLVNSETELCKEEREFINLMRPYLDEKDEIFPLEFFKLKERIEVVRKLQKDKERGFYRAAIFSNNQIKRFTGKSERKFFGKEGTKKRFNEAIDINRLVKDHFNTIALDYDEYSQKRSAYLRKQEGLIINRLKQEGGKELKILDAGCGSGKRAMNIKKLIGGSFYGYDVSNEMVKIVSQRDYELVIQSSLTDQLFLSKKGTFDAVICLFSVFCYLSTAEERNAAVKNFYESLKDRGLLFIDVTNRWHTGEGREFKKTIPQIKKELSTAIEKSNLEYGDILFEIFPKGKSIKGFFHTMVDSEFRELFEGYFDIEKRYIIGYDTGTLKKEESEGNFLYVCRKKLNNDEDKDRLLKEVIMSKDRKVITVKLEKVEEKAKEAGESENFREMFEKYR